RTSCHKSAAPDVLKVSGLKPRHRLVECRKTARQMNSQTDIFHALRPRLMGIAYRMLGTRTDAEDILHDTWLRWQTADVSEIRSPEAWLKTTATRLSIDRLRRAKVEREHHYVGPWLPEPLSEADMDSPEIALERD